MGLGVRDHCPACSFSKLNLPQRMRAGGNGTASYKARQKLWRSCCRSVAGGAMIEVVSCRRLPVEHRPHSPAVRDWLHAEGPNGACTFACKQAPTKERLTRSVAAIVPALLGKMRGLPRGAVSIVSAAPSGEAVHFGSGFGFLWELACKRSPCLWR